MLTRTSTRRRFGLSAGLILSAAAAIGSPSAGFERHEIAQIRVPDDFTTIQEAIDASRSGDVILVAPGTYSAAASRVYDFTIGESPGPRTLTAAVFLKPGVALLAEAGPEVTFIEVLETGGDVHGFALGLADSPAATIVSGFTFRKGAGTGACVVARELPAGSLLSVRDCRFEQSDGGAIEAGGIHFAHAGKLLVQRCRFSGVSSSGGFGALAAIQEDPIASGSRAALRVESSTFENCPNGAIYARAASARVVGCGFVGGRMSGAGSGEGSVFHAVTSAEARLEECTIEDCADTPVVTGVFPDARGSHSAAAILNSTFRNCSGAAGIARLGHPEVTVEDCRFLHCAGTSCAGFELTAPDPTGWFRRNAFFDVSCSGAYGVIRAAAMSGVIARNTFALCEVEGEGLASVVEVHGSSSGPQLAVSRNIFAENGGPNVLQLSGSYLEQCNDFWNNAGGAANVPVSSSSFFADPRFCDLPSGDLTLRFASPCLPPGPTGCGNVGAFGASCGTVSVDDESWGRIKSLYRSGP